MINPLSGNSLRTRADLQKAALDLFLPLKAYFSPGGARVRLGYSGAHYDDHAAELEGFARPLWGLVPLSAGGGDFTDWELYRTGLTNGTNPDHGEYWGNPADTDQRFVEMAAIALALLMVPEQTWEPLSPEARHNLASWLLTINDHQIPNNNWLWFRVLVNFALAKIGAAYDEVAMNRSLERLDEFYLGDGWYSDGPTRQRDYYISFAMHFYGLIYAKFARTDDPQRVQALRDRAAKFACDFIHWFAADGSALPFGRSLTYRFAQGAFWGALAFADVEALSWGVVKGLSLRHLRWWSRQPIFSPDGTLTIGYAYPNLNMAEQYNSPGSPYWAMKYFLLLAVPESHPFWQADEEPLPELPSLAYQPHPDMIFYRNPTGSHVVALTGAQYQSWMRHAGEKYTKFAYSTAFGFSVPSGRRGLNQLAADSMMAVSDDGETYRVREKTIESRYENGALWSRWEPMLGVEIETWLMPCAPWHIRVHHLRTDRTLWTSEGGFALDRTGDDPIARAGDHGSGDGFSFARYPAGGSGLVDLQGKREGAVLRVDPNTNLLFPRTVLPTLFAQGTAGEYWLTCAILADPDLDIWDQHWKQVPELPQFMKIKMG